MSSSRGTGTRRSNACWTCKLRRKKCDATRPNCVACESRNITCHGYGDWPEWMNGGQEEHAELGRIQKAVKENKKQKRKELFQRRAQPEEQNDEQASRVHENGEGSSAEQRGWLYDDLQDFEAAPSSSVQDAPDGPLTSTPDELRTGAILSFTPTPNTTSHFRFGYYREAELLMHYLDHVFALQFRFHSPSVANNRGWLLWLLTETKPLYHAALSLGALHQHSLLARSARGQRYHDTLKELIEHHNRALQELQIFLQSSYDDPGTAGLSRKRQLQILACGVQLVSFELFRGGISQWQVHLDALASIVSSVQRAKAVSLEQPWEMRGQQSPRLLTPGAGSEPFSHDLEGTAEQFLIGAVLWFDLTSCASTNRGPRLLQSYDSLLHGQLDLANIVGCQPWVAILIGEVAALNEWKTEAMSTNSLSFWKLFERGNPIRQRLENGIAHLRSEIDGMFAAIGLAHLSTNAAYLVMTNQSLHAEAIKRAVTLVFAYAAKVYLNTTISGANPALDDIEASVRETIDALQELRAICDLQALRSLIWPICIAGCMADGLDMQSFFRNLIRDLGDEAHDFGNSATALQVMEKCWSARDEGISPIDGKGWDWFTAMDSMGQRILLV